MKNKIKFGSLLSLIGLFLVMINPMFNGEYTIYIRLAASVFFFAFLIVILTKRYQVRKD